MDSQTLNISAIKSKSNDKKEVAIDTILKNIERNLLEMKDDSPQRTQKNRIQTVLDTVKLLKRRLENTLELPFSFEVEKLKKEYDSMKTYYEDEVPI